MFKSLFCKHEYVNVGSAKKSGKEYEMVRCKLCKKCKRKRIKS